MAQKIKQISLMVQAMHLRRMFPDSQISTQKGNSLIWRHKLSPSPMGGYYKVKLTYKLNEKPRVYVVEPKPLRKPAGVLQLEHCYNTELQELCLYYPDKTEWNESLLLSETIIPWIFDWLFHYEIWVVTGEWKGGGVHLRKDKKGFIGYKVQDK